MTQKEMVLVTGGSGFIAVHTIAQLLDKGYAVRATLRSMSRQDEVRAMVKQVGAENLEDLTFVQADLLDKESWIPATQGASYVIHVASPTPVTRPKADAEMVNMAVTGVQNVFAAAKQADVKRIVLTSASGAVLAGHKHHPEIFTENDWTNLDAPINAYQRSKTQGEQAAWEFARENDMELATILPVAVMGPVLGKDFSHSNQIIQAMFEGKMPFLLKMGFDYVDVRDVASLHLLAMETPAAAGERFLATTSENIPYKQLTRWLKAEFGAKASKVSTREIPDAVVKFLSHFNESLKMPATFLGQNTNCSHDKAAQLLDWQPRSAKEAILATAQSMIDFGIV